MCLIVRKIVLISRGKFEQYLEEKLVERLCTLALVFLKCGYAVCWISNENVLRCEKLPQSNIDFY